MKRITAVSALVAALAFPAAGAAAVTIVPRNVLGQVQTPPSEEFGGAPKRFNENVADRSAAAPNIT